MPTSVHLQYRFSTGIIPVILLAVILIAIPIVYMIIRLKEKQNAVKTEPNHKPNVVEPESVQSLYIRRVRNVEEKVNRKDISLRQGFQELSTIIRQYAKERTGIDVTNMTLAEIRGLNLPMLERTIESYYEYEFSDRYDDVNESDIMDSNVSSKNNINKAVMITVFALENWK